ncbi:T4SS-associated protein LvhB7 [Fluoribacter dumoffii]|nr:T4SS-associated protein LvhB7 [Fluoribacter dumoffii]
MFVLLALSLLSGCSSKPPDLDSPCSQFGRYCPQYPINEVTLSEGK